ncbi:MAG: helix-turn-helix domain-containing protein [Spirosomataceae bacterium]
MNHGKALLELIKRNGLTQREFSFKINLAENTVSQNFKKPKLSERTLKKYLKPFGYSIEDFEIEFGKPSNDILSRETLLYKLLAEKEARIKDLQLRIEEKNEKIKELKQQLLKFKIQ